ncbi:MAG: DUF423 domain-containing protein [Bacteroidota bacterium]
MNRTIFLTGILFGILAIVLGAFGAHGLEHLLHQESLETFKTGVQYQMYHALLLLLLGSTSLISEKKKKWTFYCILFGLIFFSFSIYLLATNTLTTFNFKVLGPITPLGGLLLITGWTILGFQAYAGFKQKQGNTN